MHNLPFKNNRTKAREVLEIVHTDLNGPHSTTGLNGEKYFLSFIDDYSKASRVYTIKSKAEVYECFLDYINTTENLTGKKIVKLRCDNGTEYLNKNIYQIAREKGITIEPCPPYSHQLNGTAERYNRTIMDTARCLLSEGKVHNKFWPEVVRTASYLKNRTLANTVEIKTPYEILTGKKPNVENLRLYGSRVFVRIPEEKRKSKWDRKADLGILLGYDNVGYRILINNKIVISRNVEIIEENVNLVGFKGVNDETDAISDFENNDDLLENENASSDGIEPPSSSNEKGQENQQSKENFELRKSNRKTKKPDWYGINSANSNYIFVNYVSADSPITYDEVLKSDECELWKNAMEKELNVINKNKTWKLVEKPSDKKVLDLKWIFTTKSENRKKLELLLKVFNKTNC